jgi:hypothetical protein
LHISYHSMLYGVYFHSVRALGPPAARSSDICIWWAHFLEVGQHWSNAPRKLPNDWRDVACKGR